MKSSTYLMMAGLKPVFSIDDICEYLNLSKARTRALVNEPGFPTPINDSPRARRWLTSEVLAYWKDKSRVRKAGTPDQTYPKPTLRPILKGRAS